MNEGVLTVDVLPAHRFDEARLHEYLRNEIDGFDGELSVRQFQGGQSNPTFLLEVKGAQYVLRKKPPGDLLPKAHQVDREYKVMRALQDTQVPVPCMHHLCEDSQIIGTSFFVMDFVQGDVTPDPSLPNVERGKRRAAYDVIIRTLARLHQVDWQAVGLSKFGRHEAYFERQLKTWTGQYEASKTEDMPAMDNLINWLQKNLPDAQFASIAHGDYRAGNLIIDANKPDVLAVLDWELSTIGHPLADLGYLCMLYHMPAEGPGVRGVPPGDVAALGLPDQETMIATYFDENPEVEVPDVKFYIAFSMFRLAAILQGVYSRGLKGNASNTDAVKVGQRAGGLASAGWRLARS